MQGKRKAHKKRRVSRKRLQVHPAYDGKEGTPLKYAHVDTKFIAEVHFGDLTDREFAEMAESIGNMFRQRLIMINNNVATVQKLRFSELTEFVTAIPVHIHKKITSGSISRQLIVDEGLPYRSAKEISGVEVVRQV